METRPVLMQEGDWGYYTPPGVGLQKGRRLRRSCQRACCQGLRKDSFSECSLQKGAATIIDTPAKAPLGPPWGIAPAGISPDPRRVDSPAVDNLTTDSPCGLGSKGGSDGQMRGPSGVQVRRFRGQSHSTPFSPKLCTGANPITNLFIGLGG